MDCIKLRQSVLGELRWVATVSRPDICARLARIASGINALCWSEVYRFNELVRVAMDWQHVTVLEYASPSHPWRALGRSNRVQRDLRKHGERAHCGSMTLAGRSGAAHRDKLTEGECRFGSAVGLTPSTFTGPCPIVRRTSKK